MVFGLSAAAGNGNREYTRERGATAAGNVGSEPSRIPLRILMCLQKDAECVDHLAVHLIAWARNGIEHPETMPAVRHQPCPFQVGEMPGDFCLSDSHDRNNIAHAEFS